MSKANDWLKIGKIGKAHGLRGAFFVRGRDEPVPAAYGTLRIGPDFKSARPAEIVSSLWQNDQSILKLDIAKDRTGIDAMMGFDIWAARDRIALDDDEEFLWSDLESRSVVDSAGQPVGTLVEVYNTGASDIAVVRSLSGASLEIALVEDYFDFDIPETGPLRLVVPAAMFEDLWQEKKKK